MDTALEKNEIIKRLRNIRGDYSERGLSWNMAKDISIDYTKFQDIPEGRYQAELLLKVWNKKFPILHCYFVDLNNDQNLFCIAAFREQDDKYSCADRNIDFSYANLGDQFDIEIGLTIKSKRNKWISADYIDGILKGNKN